MPTDPAIEAAAIRYALICVKMECGEENPDAEPTPDEAAEAVEAFTDSEVMLVYLRNTKAILRAYLAAQPAERTAAEMREKLP